MGRVYQTTQINKTFEKCAERGAITDDLAACIEDTIEIHVALLKGASRNSAQLKALGIACTQRAAGLSDFERFIGRSVDRHYWIGYVMTQKATNEDSVQNIADENRRYVAEKTVDAAVLSHMPKDQRELYKGILETLPDFRAHMTEQQVSAEIQESTSVLAA